MDRIRLIVAAVFLICLLAPERALAAERLQDIADQGEGKLVIVIDPGHGGENRGTIENGYEEKRMTMTTALAMYEELSQYEGVEVYLTHTEDVDMSLKERAEFAASVEADFLFSIHYNASASHEAFGSEVWTSAFGPYNGYGYQFGYEILTDMRDMGLLLRGVKTRFGDDGDDYYGIIRESVALEIPAVIIEHCHVDEARDETYCDSEDKQKQFGKMDATAVARYFRLKSSALQADYSGHQLVEAGAVVKATAADDTDPDVCIIDFLKADTQAYTMTMNVTAADYDSALLYYSYSTDGGISFSAREPWPDSDALTGTYKDTFTLEIPVEPGTVPRVVLRAYNAYDLYRESNCYVSSQVFPSLPKEKEGEIPDSGAGGVRTDGEPEESREIEVVPVGAIPSEKEGQGEDGVSFTAFFKLCLIIAAAMLLIVVTSQGVAYHIRRKRRRQRRNEAGRSRNQQR